MNTARGVWILGLVVASAVSCKPTSSGAGAQETSALRETVYLFPDGNCIVPPFNPKDKIECVTTDNAGDPLGYTLPAVHQNGLRDVLVKEAGTFRLEHDPNNGSNAIPFGFTGQFGGLKKSATLNCKEVYIKSEYDHESHRISCGDSEVFGLEMTIARVQRLKNVKNQVVYSFPSSPIKNGAFFPMGRDRRALCWQVRPAQCSQAH